MKKERAINIAEKKLNMKFTGEGYEYDGDYYLQMIPKNSTINNDYIMDNCYKIDSKTAKVTPYNPLIDGEQNIERINFF